MAERPQLWTRSFVCICIANFMLFFAFYLLLPIIPLYLISEFQTSKSLVGMVLSCYTIAALMVRPYSGYILDKFKRKPIYLGAYLAFVFIFIGYAEAAFLSMFITLRILHGLAYGLVSTAGNTIVVDIMPSERRAVQIKGDEPYSHIPASLHDSFLYLNTTKNAPQVAARHCALYGLFSEVPL